MPSSLLWALAGVIGVFLGVVVGLRLSKFLGKYVDKKIIANAAKFLNGKRENKFDLDGKIVEVNSFIVTDDSGNESLIKIEPNVGVSVGPAPKIEIPGITITDVKESKDKVIKGKNKTPTKKKKSKIKVSRSFKKGGKKIE